MRVVLTVIMGLSACLWAGAATAEETWREAIDALYAEWDSTETAGVAVGILDGGEFVYKKGFGMANLEKGIPIDADSMFNMASVSKQFTAAAIAKLSLDGELSLDDPVGKYFDQFPAWRDDVTIDHLVHHTSGIPDIFGVMAKKKIKFEGYWGNEHIVPILYDVELDFAPGEEHAYSNSNYILMAEIVHKVTGNSLRAYLEEHFFAPLGMTRTRVDDDLEASAGELVESYHRRGRERWVHIERDDYVVGDGNIVTTINDMAKWDANLRDPKVGGQAWRDLMYTRGVLNDDTEISYAFGLYVGDDDTYGPVVRHGGNWLGFRTQYIQLREAGVSVIVFSNCNVEPKPEELLDAYMAGRGATAP